MVAEPEFALADLMARLFQRPDGVFRSCEWLRDSWEQPGAFRRALLRHAVGQSRQPLKSSLTAGFDFYHDLILRHQAVETPALLIPERALGSPRPTSYAELHAACTRRAVAWSAAGVQAGESLCVVGVLDRELVVSLLCGLRLGLVVTILPPKGPDFLSRRLRALRPQHLALPAHYRRLLADEDWVGRPLPDDESAAGTARVAGLVLGSHTYAGESPAFALYSPLRERAEQPVALSAAAAFLAAMRDGLLLFRLTIGCTVWAPDHSLLELQPALLLTTLLQGGSYLHGLALEELPPSDPLPAAQILFASQKLRDSMLERPARPLSGVKLWLVPASEARERRWADWAAHVGLSTVPAMSTWIDAAAGGCVLFSVPQLGMPPQQVQPTPGLSFELHPPGQQGVPSRSGAAVFRAPGGDERALGILLAHWDSAFALGGTVEPLHQGGRYPGPEVEDVVASLPFVDSAAVLARAGDARDPTLVVFLGPEPLELGRELLAARLGAVRERIGQRLAPELVPTTIELLAMYPRRKQGRIDRVWLQREHAGGWLREREAHPLFRLLDRLRCAWAGPLPAGKSPALDAPRGREAKGGTP